jgi:hypothetical protein
MSRKGQVTKSRVQNIRTEPMQISFDEPSSRVGHAFAQVIQKTGTSTGTTSPYLTDPAIVSGSVKLTLEQDARATVQIDLSDLVRIIQAYLAPLMPEDEAIEDDDWSLTPEQMFFMFENHNDIEIAFEEGDMEALRTLAATEEFLSLFGEMSFDEAYDRYETVLEDGSAAS